MDTQQIEEWKQKLKEEGFSRIRLSPIPSKDLEHTHRRHTVHIITNGDLVITDMEGIKTYRVGERVEFPAGTKHRAGSSMGEGKMLIGVKEK